MARAIRRRLVPRRAAVAALTGVAMLGVSAVAGPAGATHGVNIPVATSAGAPVISTGTTNQAAGNLTLTFPPATSLAVGETIVLTLDDSDPQFNCAVPNPTTDFVAFTALPTVVTTPPAGAALTAAFTPVNALGCGATKADQLTLTVATAGLASTIVLSNIRYDVGTTGVSAGPVTITASGTAGPVPVVPTNATIALPSPGTLTVSPRVSIRMGSGATPVSNFVLSERTVDALAGPTVTPVALCISLSSGGFEPAPAPVIAVTSGTDVATTSIQNGQLSIVLVDAAADTAPSTFTVSGVRLTAATTGVAGLYSATVRIDNATCTGPGAIVAGPTDVATVVDVERLSGADRYETAQKLFEDGFSCVTPAVPNGLTDVIIARGDAFPDALAASYLAGDRNTGILLVDRETTTIPAATIAALKNRGVDNAIIVGGETAIPAALATAIDNLPNYDCAGAPQGALTMSVNRISGANRYETARNVAAGIAVPALTPSLGVVGTADYDGTTADPDGATCGFKKTAILATGENFPDALVAGPVAFGGATPVAAVCGNGRGFPIVLTTGTSLHPDAAATLTNLGIEQVLVMGGNTVIDPSVVTAVQAINSITTKRFDGINRLDTSKRFAEFAIDFLGYSRTAAGVATGFNFPDALAGGPNAGAFGLPVVLTESGTAVGAETLAFFGERQGTSGVFGAPVFPLPLNPISAIDVYGGTTAIAETTIELILAAIAQA